MSETITLTSGAAIEIHGTYDGAVDHWALGYGSAFDTVSGLSADNRKRCLASAVRYLNQQVWNSDADTFAKRDAIEVFTTAQYELAALISEDPDITQADDTGSQNIASLSAGSASISFFNPTETGSPLPPVVQRMLGDYLAGGGAPTVIGGLGNYGSCSNPFSDDEDY